MLNRKKEKNTNKGCKPYFIALAIMMIFYREEDDDNE